MSRQLFHPSHEIRGLSPFHRDSLVNGVHTMYRHAGVEKPGRSGLNLGPHTPRGGAPLQTRLCYAACASDFHISLSLEPAFHGHCANE